jgi:UDP-N-acetylglucosamine--N-acetylmuramyl-(pentapeptide) pyrophosphoryl-undecaprenol N-acetylglucosamine transferase
MYIFFTSPIGLGHATRDLAIAMKLNYDNLLFVSGSGSAKLIEMKGYKVFDVYSPPKFNVQSGQLQHSFRWLMTYYFYYRKAKVFAKNIVNRYNPRVVISDEDFASVSVGKDLSRKLVLITDITETQFTTGPISVVERMMNRRMQKMMRECDYIIIPDVGDDRDNIRYVGPIVRPTSADRDTLRRRFGFTKNTIVVSIGGTDAGKYLVEKAISVHRRLKLDSELVIISGPSLNLPNSDKYRNLGFVDNLHELIYAADLVVSLAGRSTMDESIAYGTPGIFIPIKNHFEQERGAARLGFKYTDIFRLDSLIEENLSKKRRTVYANGAEKAAKIITSLCA